MSADEYNDTTLLFRPVGPQELALIAESDYRTFPPRLPHQPIFYPVLNVAYATQIARDWNATDASTSYTGFVTRFRVKTEFLRHYQVQNVGGSIHQAYWISAEDLPELNNIIIGLIEVIAEFHGTPN